LLLQLKPIFFILSEKTERLERERAEDKQPDREEEVERRRYIKIIEMA